MREKGSLLKIFWATFMISAFTFGGGYVIITLIKKRFVDDYHWIDEEEMLDMVAISQSAPGPIAINGSIVVGYKLAGVLGAGAAILGTVLPPFIIISVISLFYEAFKNNAVFIDILSGMQAGVSAVIASVVYDMASNVVKKKKIDSVVIMIAAFIATCVYNVNVVYVVLACIALGILQTFVFKKEG